MAARTEPDSTGRLAPVRSSIRPPICANTTKPMKKYKISRLEVVAFSPRAICPYNLAKKNTGMNTSIEMPSTRFSTRNGLIRKMLTWISGDSVRSSTR